MTQAPFHQLPHVHLGFSTEKTHCQVKSFQLAFTLIFGKFYVCPYCLSKIYSPTGLKNTQKHLTTESYAGQMCFILVHQPCIHSNKICRKIYFVSVIFIRLQNTIYCSNRAYCQEKYYFSIWNEVMQNQLRNLFTLLKKYK